TTRSLAGMILAAAFMGAVIVVEVVAAWLLFPSADDIVAQAKREIEQSQPRSNDPVDEIAPEKPTLGTVERDLGDFSVTSYQPTSNVTLRIDFHLYGAILASDDAQFSQLFESNKNRFREQVIVTVRNANLNDLTDPALGLLKRKILEKTNALF